MIGTLRSLMGCWDPAVVVGNRNSAAFEFQPPPNLPGRLKLPLVIAMRVTYLAVILHPSFCTCQNLRCWFPCPRDVLPFLDTIRHATEWSMFFSPSSACAKSPGSEYFLSETSTEPILSLVFGRAQAIRSVQTPLIGHACVRFRRTGDSHTSSIRKSPGFHAFRNFGCADGASQCIYSIIGAFENCRTYEHRIRGQSWEGRLCCTSVCAHSLGNHTQTAKCVNVGSPLHLEADKIINLCRTQHVYLEVLK